MTHEFLPHVVDEACPDRNIDGIGRLIWQLALLPEFVNYIIFVCIHVVVCVYSHVIECKCC